MGGQAGTDEPRIPTHATVVRRSPQLAPRPSGADAPAVRTTSVGGGPRLLPRRARRDWATEAAAIQGARPLEPTARWTPQLGVARHEPPAGELWRLVIKWSGYRVMAKLQGGNATLRNRAGEDWTGRFPGVVRALEAMGLAQAWIDGEVVALDRQGRSDRDALQRALQEGDTEHLRLLAFDLPALQQVDLRGTPLLARKRLLERVLAAQPSPLLAYSRHLVGHGSRVFAASKRQGVEGIVSKRVDAHYQGGRSEAWIKVRHDQADAFVVVGHAGPVDRPSSLLLAIRHEHGLRYTGRARIAAGSAEARALATRLRRIPAAPAVAGAPTLARVRWLRADVEVEVAYRGWDADGMLRDASFRRLREDRPRDEIEAEAGMEIRITHPERVVFVASGDARAVTKGEVADYYRAVARWMLPELARRPLSLVRCPEGSEGACFFQKHHSGSFGTAVKAVALEQKDGVHDYLYVEDVDGLLALVQMNSLEFHPWGSRVDAPEKPDRLVFDLDPDTGIEWKQVVAAAREVRARLREAGLESFVRQTGGKGLHVVAPFRRGPGWQAAKDFSEALAGAMAAERPERYVATMSKARREGRIFIDWLRNSRGATSVTSWSLRARPGAPVAMPLRWEELGKVEGPGAFGLARALRRAASLRRDPWDGIDALDQRLPN